MTLLGVPLGRGSGRARYAEAMTRYNAGEISANQLEAYRIASAEDFLGPEVELQKIKGPALPLTPQINQP
jgi:hypothetical protein